jgi:thiosulfate/3-mercaptopyruvate sulfurtransferase
MNTSMIRWIATAALSITALAAQAGLLPGPIVETTWLAANASQVQVVEIRSNVKSYTSKPEIAVDAKGKKTIEEVGGHIPGALLANFKNLRGDRIINGKKVQYMIPEAADFEKIVRQTGVLAGKPIVLVPVGAEVADVDEALRLYWQFKVYGEDDVAVLNGGYMAWLLEPRHPHKAIGPSRATAWLNSSPPAMTFKPHHRTNRPRWSTPATCPRSMA